MSESWGIIVISVGTVVGGFIGTVILTHIMDCISIPIERRRKVELAASRATSAKLRELVLDKLFPERLYDVNNTITENLTDEEAAGELQPCAICIEGFQRGDSVIEGQRCHHTCHRHCLMTWLQNHNDCPVCRDTMWTRDTFIEAKKQVFQDDPDVLEKEWASIVAQLRQGVVLVTNQEPDDIVIETLNTNAPSPEEAPEESTEGVSQELEMTPVTPTNDTGTSDEVEADSSNENANEDDGTTEEKPQSALVNIKDTVVVDEEAGPAVVTADVVSDRLQNTIDMDGESVDDINLPQQSLSILSVERIETVG